VGEKNDRPIVTTLHTDDTEIVNTACTDNCHKLMVYGLVNLQNRCLKF